MAYLVPATAAFLGTVLLVLAIGMSFTERRRKDGSHRLHSLLEVPHGEGEASIVINERKFSQDWLNAIESVLTRIVTLDHLVEQAGLRLSTTWFFVLCGTSGILGACLSLIVSAPPPLIPVAGAGFALIPLFWLLFRRSRRQAAFAAQLPDALEMMSRGLRAGHSVPSAMQLAAQEMLPPLSLEFERCCQRQALGVSLVDSVSDMLRRVPNDDMRFFYTAVKMQQRFGGNLAEILDTISTIVRDRFQILGQVQALTGEGRLSGIVLLVLPVVVFLGLYYCRPEYIAPLFDDPVGRQMLAISIVLQLVGAIAIRKIVSIKI